MINDRTDRTPMPEPPAWLPLSPESARRAWEIGQSAPPMSADVRAAVAILVRPVVL